MAEQAAVSDWEQLKLEELALVDPKKRLAPAALRQKPVVSVGKASEDGKAALSPAPPPAASPFTAAEDVLTSQDDDQAVLYALACSNDRTLVLAIEEDVLGFISDTNRDVLEFSPVYGNYQRLLAHRVAQYHGLQTSTADYEGTSGRVVAHRKSVETKTRPKLSQLTLSQATVAAAAEWAQAGRQGSPAPLPSAQQPKLLRREAGSDSQRSNSGDADRTHVARSAKDREEEYNKARQRIIGEPAAPPSSGSPSAPGTPPPGLATNVAPGVAAAVAGAGRGTGTGRFVPVTGRGAVPGAAAGGVVAGRGGEFVGGRGMGRGGRKGGRGDRSAELQHDPDYARGPNRYSNGGAYDAASGSGYGMMHGGGMYGMPYMAEGQNANRKFTPPGGAPAALLPPPPPPNASAAMASPYMYPSSPAAGSAAMAGHPMAPTPYGPMTSMGMAYPPTGMATPPMYGAMPGAYNPYHPMAHPMAGAMHGAAPYPAPYPTPHMQPDPSMAAAAAMQGMHMHNGYGAPPMGAYGQPMPGSGMTAPGMHAMAPNAAMGCGMPPYPPAMAAYGPGAMTPQGQQGMPGYPNPSASPMGYPPHAGGMGMQQPYDYSAYAGSPQAQNSPHYAGGWGGSGFYGNKRGGRRGEYDNMGGRGGRGTYTNSNHSSGSSQYQYSANAGMAGEQSGGSRGSASESTTSSQLTPNSAGSVSQMSSSTASAAPNTPAAPAMRPKSDNDQAPAAAPTPPPETDKPAAAAAAAAAAAPVNTEGGEGGQAATMPVPVSAEQAQ